MAKLSFIAGLAAGYVLGSRAGRQRYEQIRRTSGKVWNSGPVQKQVASAKEAARTKAAPVVADMVADAARATGEKLRSSRTVSAQALEPSEATATGPATNEGQASNGAPTSHGTGGSNGTAQARPEDPWATATSRTDGAA